ncbi:transposase [Streptomyces sp. SID12501]|uniref:transposase n=1 Tax=Streptomyces sp. SID12501 TaxID=2706042 RepID=UPI0031BA11F5
MSLLCAFERLPSNAAARSCDHLAHAYGNAVGHRDRERRYPSDMSDAEWAAVRPLLPVPAWLWGGAGSPEGHCHRQLLDTIRHLVTDRISWRAMPADFSGWGRVRAFFRRWRERGLITEFHDRLRGKSVNGRAARQGPRRGHRRAVGAGRRDGVGSLTRLRGRREGAGPQTAHRDRHPLASVAASSMSPSASMRRRPCCQWPAA